MTLKVIEGNESIKKDSKPIHAFKWIRELLAREVELYNSSKECEAEKKIINETFHSLSKIKK